MKMNNRNKLIMRVAAAIVTVTSIYIFAPWEFALYYLYPLPSSVNEQVDEATRQDIDGIIVYVHQNGQEPELYASGWHDRAKEIPAKPDALFKIASIGKLYDAAAVAKLVASGQLSLDNTIADTLPSLAGRIEYADRITLRMMVEHRSGIPNFTDHENYSWSDPSLDVMELILDEPANFEPGTDYSYSNSNYVLLQKIIDTTLGYSYWKYIEDEILAPLELEQTYISVNEIDPDELMSGYYVGYDDDFKALDQGYIASAEDVGVFLQALNNGTLLSDKEQEIYSSIYEYEHTGWVLGYSSIARYHRDIDTVVIQFVNTTGNDTVMLTSIIYNRVMKILRNQTNSGN